MDIASVLVKHRHRLVDARMRKLVSGVMVATLTAMAWGCGGGGGVHGGGTDGGDAAITGVNANKKLVTLSSSEKTQFCADLANYSNSVLIPAECRVAGLVSSLEAASNDSTLTDADLRSACSSASVQCGLARDGSSAPGPGGDAASVPDGSAPDAGTVCDGLSIPPSCTATVRDITSCLSSEEAYYDGFPSCDAVSRVVLDTLAADGGFSGASSPACSAMLAQCGLGAS
jgi:hypothetical protein